MPLQQIRPDFSGSAESMGQAQKSIGQVGQYANELMDRLAKERAVATEQARYDTEQARLKVADDRATEQYLQQKATRQGIIDTEQAKTMAAPYAKDVVAFNDPRYADALAAWQAAGNTDITESAKILGAYGASQPQALQQQQAQYSSEQPQGLAVQQPGDSSGAIYVDGTKQVTKVVPGKAGYVKGDPTVTYMKPGSATSPATPTGDVLSYKKDKYGRVQPSFSGANLGAKISDALPMTSSIVKGLLGTEDNEKKLAMLKGANGEALSDMLLGGQLTKENRALLKEAIIKDRSLSTNIPASSARDPNAAGQALLDAFDKDAATKIKDAKASASGIRNTALSTIDQTTMYNKKGKLLTGAASSDSVYFKSKNGDLVNALDVGKAMQNSFQPGTAATTKVSTIPTREKIMSGVVAPINVTMKQLATTASREGIPVQAVQGTVAKVNSGYQSILELLGKDNNKERDALREMVASQASQNGLLPNEYDVGKAVDTIMPANDLTGRQQAAVNVSLKELDAARDDFWKNKEMSFKEREAAWDRIMDQQKLSLERAGLSLKSQELKQSKSESAFDKTYATTKAGIQAKQNNMSLTEIAKENEALYTSKESELNRGKWFPSITGASASTVNEAVEKDRVKRAKLELLKVQ